MNSYPTVRGFTAIGTGGDDFVQAMVVAVESVLQQPIPEVNVPFCLLNSSLEPFIVCKLIHQRHLIKHDNMTMEISVVLIVGF